MATWRISLNNQTVVTYASVGIRVDYALSYISAVLNSFAGPNGTIIINVTNTTTDVQSASTAVFPSVILALGLLLISILG